MELFSELERKLQLYLTPDQINDVRHAYLIAKDAHGKQKRLTGEPYIIHPVSVASILAEMHFDTPSIITALLHDTLEDTKLPKEKIATEFGQEVAELVDGVTKLTKIKFESRIQAQAENFRKMVMATAKDIRVILIKLADRLDNMKTIDCMPSEKKKRISLETLEIYAPIANRLGMYKISLALEKFCFAALHPVRYRILNAAILEANQNRKEIHDQIVATIKAGLIARQVEEERVYTKEKHVYSVYRKMRKRHVPFMEIIDTYTIRILVHEVDTCYRALGIVHNTYKPIPGRFKDYIALPKANGYQSLHTTLYGPFGIPIEIHIRTTEMNDRALNGIAADWFLDTSGKHANEAQNRARSWVNSLIDLQDTAKDSVEFVENVKSDLFPDKVYVFTPQGGIIELPAKATPVDFAYAVHSDIGNTCVAAKVDHEFVPLSTQLHNGQRIEILTDKNSQANPAWLNFVVTGRARSKIRASLRNRRSEESMTFGKRMLEKALESYSLSLTDFFSRDFETLFKKRFYHSMEDLFESIGLGNENPMMLARYLAIQTGKGDPKKLNSPLPTLAIRGTESMVLNFAKCCQPIPNDPIVGILEPGQGITVHMNHCRRVHKYRLDPSRFLNLTWEEDVQGDFRVNILIGVFDCLGLLAKIASEISATGSNINTIRVDEHDDNHQLIYLTLSVHDRKHLAQIMKRIRTIPNVNRISRDRE